MTKTMRHRYESLLAMLPHPGVAMERKLVLCLAMTAMLLPAGFMLGQSAPVEAAPEPSRPAATDASEKTPVKVAVLTYANGHTSKCFAPGFLDTVARNTRIVVQREFSLATLGEATLHNYPFIVMTGEKDFTLSDKEKEALKSYLHRGGFILASAGCSNEDWSKSFVQVFREIMPDQKLTKLEMDHPIFHSIYDIQSLPSRKAETQGQIFGLSLGGRLAVAFSPMGLNDTENAGGGCCCCGGNELKDAHRINANILAYVLTH